AVVDDPAAGTSPTLAVRCPNQEQHWTVSWRCSLVSFLVVVLAIFAALAGVQTYITLEQTEMHSELAVTVQNHQAAIDKLLFVNLTYVGHGFMLSQIESFVRRSILCPVENAVDAMLSVMAMQRRLNRSWSGKTSEERRFLPVAAHEFLSTSQLSEEGLKLEFFGRRASENPVQTIFPSVRVVRIGFTSGQFAAVTYPQQLANASADVLFEDGNGDGVLRRRSMDYQSGELHPGAVETREAHPVKTWPCMQDQHARGKPGVKVETRWTGVHNGADGGVVVTRAAPLAFCGHYDCFEGVVSADMSLDHLSSILSTAFSAMKEVLPGICPSHATVYMVVRESKTDPPGLFLGSSMMSLEAMNCELHQARDLGGKEGELVRSSARVIEAKFGSWNSSLLSSRRRSTNIIHYSLAAATSDTPEYKDCDAQKASWNHDLDCMVVGTQTFDLDEDTSWLIVTVLPTIFHDNLVSLATERTKESKTQVDAAEQLKFDSLLALAALAAAAVAAVFMLLVLSWFVSRPLQELSNLKELMVKLGDLELDDGQLSHLRAGHRSRIQEVCHLQNAFCRMMRGVESFTRFVPKKVVRDIVCTDGCHHQLLHARRRKVTIMFSDVANFTTIAESLKEADLLFFLTRYLAVMTTLVESYQGEIAEILGDGLLIFWNTPEDVRDHATKACMTAIAMQRAIPHLNRQLVGYGLPPLSIRIGIHTGTVLSGLIGSARRLKFGCMGDAVNLASRMEGLCKFFGVGVLCSGATMEDTSSDYEFIFRRLGNVQVKGKKYTTMTYEVMGLFGKKEKEPGASPSNSNSSTGRSPPNREITLQVDKTPNMMYYYDSSTFNDSSTKSLCSTDLRSSLEAATCERASNLELLRMQAVEFESALEAYESGDLSRSVELCDALLQECPDDGPCLRLRKLVTHALDSKK
ncbi:cya1, partial [Symbiodinium sp. KB8]